MAGTKIELMPDEQMVVDSHPHWWYFWKQLLESVGVVLLAVIALTLDGALGTLFKWLAVIGFIGWIGHTIFQLVEWRTSQFALTTKRVIYQSGLFRRKSVSIPLNRINNVNSAQSFIARLLHNGSLKIESAGDTGDTIFENIPDPEGVRTKIFHQIDADAEAGADRDAAAIARAMQPPSAAAQPTVSDRLQQLDQMKAKGLLSDSEYESKRQSIIGEL